MARSKKALRLWLVVVAGMRVFGIYLAGLKLDLYRQEVYSSSVEISDPFGRLVVSWTAMSLVCCLLSAWDPWNAGVRIATMFSFVNAIAYFSFEILTGVVPFEKAIRPLCVAVPSLVWLAIDWWQDNAAAAAAATGGPKRRS